MACLSRTFGAGSLHFSEVIGSDDATASLPTPVYTFKHALTREVAYQSLLRRMRQQCHAQIAQTVVERFPELATAQPELVAHHFTEAGLCAPAVEYWQRAGQRAAQSSAYVEAMRYLTRGLALLTTLPDTPARARQELALHLALGPVVVAARGHADREVEGVYTRALQLCQQVGEAPKRFPALFGLWRFHNARLQFHMARELGEQCLLLAQQAGEPTLLLEAHFALGATLFFLGEIPPAHGHFEQGAVLYNPAAHQSLAWHYGLDPGVWCISHAAHALWFLGYPDQALHRLQAALALAAGLSHPLSLAAALFYAAMLHCFRREGHAAQARAEAAMALSNQHEFPQWSTLSLLYRGLALALQGQHPAGLAQVQQGLAAYHATGSQLVLVQCLVPLAEEHGKAGEAHTGLAVLAEAQALMERTAGRLFEAELQRLKGELLLAVSSDTHVQAEQCFAHALALARRQQAKAFELRAAMSLSRLWHQHGKRPAAHRLLAEVYGWFTEGFATPDLQEARALLTALA
jgi:predicted ATPase